MLGGKSSKLIKCQLMDTTLAPCTIFKNPQAIEAASVTGVYRTGLAFRGGPQLISGHRNRDSLPKPVGRKADGDGGANPDFTFDPQGAAVRFD